MFWVTALNVLLLDDQERLSLWEESGAVYNFIY